MHLFTEEQVAQYREAFILFTDPKNAENQFIDVRGGSVKALGRIVRSLGANPTNMELSELL